MAVAAWSIPIGDPSGLLARRARTNDFQLGALSVRPSHRELVHRDGRREVIEPRVMQVLVVLATAPGMVSSEIFIYKQIYI